MHSCCNNNFETDETNAEAVLDAWEGFLADYGVLLSMAQQMPDLAADLQPVVEFILVKDV